MAFTTVRSATGVDFIGTPGVDVGVFVNETGNVVATGLGSDDVMTVNNADNIQRSTTLQGGEGNDQFFINDDLANSSINGNQGNDTIDLRFLTVSNSFIGGGGGADLIDGFDGEFLNVNASAGAGADTLNLDDADLVLSTINGNDGNDTIIIQDGAFLGAQNLNSSSINGNAGNDIIRAVNLRATLFGDNFFGAGAGDDTIDFFGATSDSGSAGTGRGFNLNGGSGNDTITGSTEDDTISGGADNDSIQGQLGEDTILAGAGDDLIFADDDVITGGAGADDYRFAGGTSTFVITAIANSAAATSGTTRTFDTFFGYGNFGGTDELDITAVTNQLAGGQYVGPATTAAQANLGALGAFTDFGTLKTALDGFFLGASNTNTIQTYTFSAAIDGGPVLNYLWIQDSQSSYSSADLLFQTTALGSIPGGFITVA